MLLASPSRVEEERVVLLLSVRGRVVLPAIIGARFVKLVCEEEEEEEVL